MQARGAALKPAQWFQEKKSREVDLLSYHTDHFELEIQDIKPFCAVRSVMYEILLVAVCSSVPGQTRSGELITHVGG